MIFWLVISFTQSWNFQREGGKLFQSKHSLNNTELVLKWVETAGGKLRTRSKRNLFEMNKKKRNIKKKKKKTFDPNIMAHFSRWVTDGRTIKEINLKRKIWKIFSSQRFFSSTAPLQWWISMFSMFFQGFIFFSDGSNY